MIILSERTFLLLTPAVVLLRVMICRQSEQAETDEDGKSHVRASLRRIGNALGQLVCSNWLRMDPHAFFLSSFRIRNSLNKQAYEPSSERSL